MNKQSILEAVNKFTNTFNINIRRFPNRDYRRLIQYINANNIDITLDIGANIGQYANFLFKCKYQGRIISFEPQSDAFEKLNNKIMSSNNKNRWQAIRCAMGNQVGTIKINNSKNSVSSSILPILNQHIKAAKDSVYISSEEVNINTVDQYLTEHNIAAEKVFLKIDTQGFENNVLIGANNSLQKIKVLQLEMATVPLYDGEVVFDDLKKKIESFGFHLSSIESGIADEQTGRLLQVDAIFVK